MSNLGETVSFGSKKAVIGGENDPLWGSGHGHFLAGNGSATGAPRGGGGSARSQSMRKEINQSFENKHAL